MGRRGISAILIASALIILIITGALVGALLTFSSDTGVNYQSFKDDPNDQEADDELNDPYSLYHPEEIGLTEITEEEEEKIFRDAYDCHSDEKFEEALTKWHIIYRSTSDLQTWGKAAYNNRGNYTVYLPIPEIKSGENETYMVYFDPEDIVILNGSPELEFLDTEHGRALEICGNSSCLLELNITVENKKGVSRSDLLDRFSMGSGDYYNWVYYESDTMICAEIGYRGKWLSLPPNYEYCCWDTSWITDDGWENRNIFYK